eukprot:1159093-Pelagomonas_calceolata.AAC.2
MRTVPLPMRHSELRITEEDIQAMEAEQQRGCQEELLYGDGDYMVGVVNLKASSSSRRSSPHCKSLWDGPEEAIEFVNDGSQQDAETNQFDRIVGALTGQAAGAFLSSYLLLLMHFRAPAAASAHIQQTSCHVHSADPDRHRH